MHELSICRSIADIVNRHAEDREVRRVHVRVGQLRQIIPETLVYCWSIVSAQTRLAGSILRETLRRLAGRLRIGVIEGDIETSLDADRLAGLGAVIALLNTGNDFGGECHLDAPMVRSVLPRLPLDELDLIIVENVGNLVCPAEFKIGEHSRAMVFSITEGEDKPRKYPVMFRSADLVLVNKIDLLAHLEVDMDLFYENLYSVNPTVRTIETSARTGLGIDDWCSWLTTPRKAAPT